ncbi:MAG: 7-carboxy-7-deazaguanine synthase QueE [Candidatus Peribacteraceae bacterium]|nr:7-carboxy-7-deazaguanine synthase QueE [Candidatus Peribacteraceae bacterium]
MSIKVSEAFYTIQGEGKDVGKPAFFIRLVGCYLRCKFCDSKHSWVDDDRNIKLSDVTSSKIAGDYIVLTGGEPFLHINDLELKEFMNDLSGYDINVETTGIIDNDITGKNAILNIFDFMSKVGNGKNKLSFVVSPKLDVDCYTQKGLAINDIHNFYRIPADGINWVLKQEIERLITYKFIYTPEMEPALDFIIQTIPDWFRDNVYIMPMTNIENFTKEEYYESCERTIEFCKKTGIRYSPREHISIWGLKRGV